MSIGLFVFWAAAAAAGLLGVAGGSRRQPWLTQVFCIIAALALGLQALHPALLDLFQRDASQILRGEWWLIGSALFFQDGGLAGGASNFAALLCIGGLAEQRL